MPVYNSDPFLAEAIESLLNQSFREFELIILDDCSTDSSMEVAASYKDARIRIELSSSKQGQANLLNKGIQLARYEFIAIAHSDDINMPQRLEHQINFLQNNPSTGVVGTFMRSFGEGLQETLMPLPQSPAEVAGGLLFYCSIAHPSVMLRRSLLQETSNWYKQEFVPCEDYELWTRLVPHTQLCNIAYFDVHYRMHANQISQRRKELTVSLDKQVQENYFQQEFPFLQKEDKQLFDKMFYLDAATRIDRKFIYRISEIQKALIHSQQKDHFWTVWIMERMKKLLMNSSNYSFGAGLYALIKNAGSRRLMTTRQKLTVLYRSFFKFS